MSAAADTRCARLNEWIAIARTGGLDVEVTPEIDGIIESYSVRVRMPQVEARNALDQYHNSQWISIYALRAHPGSARPFKIHATMFTMVGHRTVRPTTLPHTISGLVDDLRKRNERSGHTTEETK